ncbi:IS4 family transposase [Amycolatopsis sp.]|uniref:IS4 family transposase n=1 Tax=Amycolatopsis sp. TaxID=37632 RepID=UPI0039C8AAD0
MGEVSRRVGDRLTDRIGIGVLTRVFHRDLVDEVLITTRKNERRVRLLPARVVVYYVLALTLFFGDSYEEVMRKMVNGLRFARTWRQEWTVPSSSALTQARTRLGPEPLRELFLRAAVPLAAPGSTGAWYNGLRVMAIDGVVLDTPDTPDNVDRFGKRGHKDGESAYPQIRVVGLVECGTHAMVGAVLDSWRVYERELTERLLDQVEPDMLITADRGFFSYDLWKQACATSAHLLWRVSAPLALPVLTELPDGSYLSELLPKNLKAALNAGKKRTIPDGARIPVRVIEYQVSNRPGSETIRLITTLTDHEEAPGLELAALYAERWEFEITLDEIETHQLGGYRVLRSKKPDLIEQEVWGMLLTHYAIRHLMHEAADNIDIDEDRLSFLRSLRVVRRSIASDADFPPK